MYVYFSCGIRNTVSTVLDSLRFMSAIWNSYSKSETARMPRTMQSARSRATRSMSRPSKATIRKLFRRSAVASSIIVSRSSTVNNGSLAGLATTATISSSKIRRLRWMTSTWPLCTGSNIPGYTARLATLDPLTRIGSGPRIVVRAPKKSQGCLPESARAERRERARDHGRALGEMLGDHHAVRRRETAGADVVEGRVTEAALVRWVEEHDVEAGALAHQTIERARDVFGEDSSALLQAERRDVVAERGDGAAVALDERRVDGAPRQRCQPDTAGPGRAVEDARPRQPRHQRVHQGDPHLIRRRPRGRPAGRGESPPLQPPARAFH